MKKITKDEKKKGERSLRKITRLLPYFSRYKKLWISEIIILVGICALSMFVPIFTGNMLAKITEFNFINALYLLIWVAVFEISIPLAKAASTLLYQYVYLKVDRDLREDVDRTILSLSMRKIDVSSHGIFLERINTDCSRCSESLMLIIDSALTILANVVFFVYIAFLNLYMFLIVLLYVASVVVVESFKEKNGGVIGQLLKKAEKKLLAIMANK